MGRYEAGRGLGRVFAAVGVELVGFVLVIGGGRLVKFPIPKLGPDFKRSREAEGRKRVPFTSPPMLPDMLSFDGDGRRAVDRGVGRRDIGRGSPLDLPGAGTLSSMAECALPVPGDIDALFCWRASKGGGRKRLGRILVYAGRNVERQSEKQLGCPCDSSRDGLLNGAAGPTHRGSRRRSPDPFNVIKVPMSRLQLPQA